MNLTFGASCPARFDEPHSVGILFDVQSGAKRAKDERQGFWPDGFLVIRKFSNQGGVTFDQRGQLDPNLLVWFLLAFPEPEQSG